MWLVASIYKGVLQHVVIRNTWIKKYIRCYLAYTINLHLHVFTVCAFILSLSFVELEEGEAAGLQSINNLI